MHILTDEQREDFNWSYEFTKVPTAGGALLVGVLEGVAMNHPTWTFWQVLHEAHMLLKPTEREEPSSVERDTRPV